ncbi:hypothetical protein [Streptomyces roseolus]|uniref:hypothetical protein n=1 Tax=Streptomyces roseolus TaxID=67358 RepID=UPI0036CF7619
MKPVDELLAAKEELRKAEDEVKRLHAAYHAKIADISRRKAMSQAEVSRVTEYSRETIRRITRAAEAAEGDAAESSAQQGG